MSHWCAVQVKCKDLTLTERAVGRMGLRVVDRNKEVALYGNKSQAELILDNDPHTKLPSVGLAKQANGSFQMVGDFYHASNSTLRGYYNRSEKFASELQTAYMVEEAKQRVETEGFTIQTNPMATIGDNGLIEMVAIRSF